MFPSFLQPYIIDGNLPIGTWFAHHSPEVMIFGFIALLATRLAFPKTK